MTAPVPNGAPPGTAAALHAAARRRSLAELRPVALYETRGCWFGGVVTWLWIGMAVGFCYEAAVEIAAPRLGFGLARLVPAPLAVGLYLAAAWCSVRFIAGWHLLVLRDGLVVLPPRELAWWYALRRGVMRRAARGARRRHPDGARANAWRAVRAVRFVPARLGGMVPADVCLVPRVPDPARVPEARVSPAPWASDAGEFFAAVQAAHARATAADA